MQTGELPKSEGNQLVKTYVVRARDKVWMGNAEAPEEAVKYAIAKEGLISQQYLVYDANELNRWLIDYKDVIMKVDEREGMDPGT
jgi:hypothetical protein